MPLSLSSGRGDNSSKVVPTLSNAGDRSNKSDTSVAANMDADHNDVSTLPSIEKKPSNAARNWAKVRMAQKMTAAFKEVNDDVKAFGTTNDDSHIDWGEIYATGEGQGKLPFLIIDPHSGFRMTWDLFMR